MRLLVDDVLDKGHTLKAVHEGCYRRCAIQLLIDALCTKSYDRLVEGIHAAFNGLVMRDRYVFGYGMVYFGRARNLPWLFALREKEREADWGRRG